MNSPDYGHGARGGAKGHWNPDGSWTWDTGDYAGTTIPATQAQANADLYNQSVADQAAAQKAQDDFARKNGEGKYEGNGQYGVRGQTDLSGATDASIEKPSKTPGGTLDTNNSDAERMRMEDLLSGLQQQAATGGGAWEKTLSDAIHNAQATASALGQSQANTGGNAGDALRNIGNAQSAAAQRGVGEGNILRAETQQNAAAQLDDLLGTEGNQDLAQAASDASARHGVREANQALQEEGQKATLGYLQGGAQAGAVVASASDGGTVPGFPNVFGDDSRNDTVPAMLSPGEIVVPRSAARSPNKAADFARAIAAHHAQHFADGGQSWQPGDEDPTDKGFTWTGMPTFAPSIENGGLLNTGLIDQNRTSSLSTADMLGAWAAGRGPSAAPQMLTNAQDDTIEGTMQAQQQARASNAAALLSAATARQQHEGANAAGTAQKESEKARREQVGITEQQRARDIATAQAQQQAEWKNTLSNIGVSLANQHLLQGITGAAGQGAAAFASALKGKGGEGGGSGTPSPDASGGSDFNANLQPDVSDLNTGDNVYGTASPEGDYNLPEEGSAQSAWRGGRISAAHGGQVPDSLFAQALAGGGMADTPLASALLRENVQRLAGGGEARHMLQSASMGKRREPTDVMQSPKQPYEDAYERQRRKAEEREEETGERAPTVYGLWGGGVPGYADGGVSGDPRWPNYVDSEAMQSVEPSVSAAPVSSAPPALPQDRYPLPVGGSSMPMTPVEAKVASRMAHPVNVEQDNAEKVLQARQDRAEAGIKPGAAPMSTPKAPAPITAPVATQKPTGGARGPSASDAEAKQYAEATSAEQKAILAKGEAEAQQGAETAKALAGARNQLEQIGIEEKEKYARARAAQSEMVGQHKQLLDEMRKVDTSVDPGRFWASRTTGQKILGIIGLALGAVGAGKDGVNRAAGMLSQAIDRDIEAQKAETEARLRKGGAALSASQQMYAMNRQIFQDDIAGTAAAKISGIELAQNQLQQIAATAASPIAKAQAQQLWAQLEGAKAKFRSDLDMRAADIGLKRAETTKAYAEAAKAGVSGAGGNNELKDAQAGAVTALNTIKKIKQTLQITRDLGEVAPFGAKTLATGAAQKFGPLAASLSGDTANLVTQLKDAEKLGAISAGDYDLLMRQIGDPSDFWTTEGSKDAKLKALEERVKDSINNRRAANGLAPLAFEASQ